MEYKDLKKEIEETKKKLKDLRTFMFNSTDGYKYACRVSSYGSSKITIYFNEYIAQDLSNHYNGDNGNCYITTTNPDSSLECTEGRKAHVLTEKQFNERFKKQIEHQKIMKEKRKGK